MTKLFDGYRRNYRNVVQSSIDFSGLPHSFFMRAKADVLRELIARRLGAEKPAMLDVGCGVGSFHPMLRGMVGRLSGIDICSASIAQARTDNTNVDYRDFDGVTFPFEDRLRFGQRHLRHAPRPACRMGALCERDVSRRPTWRTRLCNRA